MKIQKNRLDIVLCVIAMIIAAMTIFCDNGSNENEKDIGSPSSEIGCGYSFEISNPYEDETFHVGTPISFEVTTDVPSAGTYVCEWNIITGGTLTTLGTGFSLIDDTLDLGTHTIEAILSDFAEGACQDSVTIHVVDSDVCIDDFIIISPSNSDSFTTGDTITFEVSADPEVGPSSVSWNTSIGGISTAIGTGNPLNDDTLEKGDHTITATNLDSPECQDSVSIQINDPIVSSTISIPDTGVDTFYNDDPGAITITEPQVGDPFFGQDAHYEKTISHTSDDTGAISIVTDNVTGLVWQKEDSGTTRDWQGARDYCTGLGTDWRLPNQAELMTIVNYGAVSPVDFTEFDTRSNYYWSNTASAEDSSKAWAVSFYNGHSQTINKASSTGMYARCVSDTGAPFPGDHTFETLPTKPEIIQDVTTGYQWHQVDNGSSSLNWSEALAHCENSQVGNYDDWKLPDVKELNTIVDRSSNSAPLIDPLFSTTAVGQYDSQNYWTSTTDINSVGGSFGEAWQVDFKTGHVGPMYKQYGTPAFVRCVRIP